MPELLSVEQDEWEMAERFFIVHPKATKFEKKQYKTKHSFIKVNNTLYAKKPGEPLGKGGFSKLKLAQNRAGENFAVKIEGGSVHEEISTEVEILKSLDRFHGTAERKYKKYFMKKYEQFKYYIIMNYYEGNELFEHLYESCNDKFIERKISQEKRLRIAIKATESIEILHCKRIIHADIKPENFMASCENNMIKVAAIDFGLSLNLPDGQEFLKFEKFFGTEIYMGPEVWKGRYSFASDVYALGKMFCEDLRLKMDKTFYDKILAKNPNERATLPEILNNLYHKLESLPNLSKQAKDMIIARRIKTKIGGLAHQRNKELQEVENQLSKLSLETSDDCSSSLSKSYNSESFKDSVDEAGKNLLIDESDESVSQAKQRITKPNKILNKLKAMREAIKKNTKLIFKPSNKHKNPTNIKPQISPQNSSEKQIQLSLSSSTETENQESQLLTFQYTNEKKGFRNFKIEDRKKKYKNSIL